MGDGLAVGRTGGLAAGAQAVNKTVSPNAQVIRLIGCFIVSPLSLTMQNGSNHTKWVPADYGSLPNLNNIPNLDRRVAATYPVPGIHR